MEVTAHNRQRGTVKPVELMGKGMRSIYMLSLLETYISEQGRIPSIIVVEDPEIFLHPQLQKTCSEILYRLSKKIRSFSRLTARTFCLISAYARYGRWCWMMSGTRLYARGPT